MQTCTIQKKTVKKVHPDTSCKKIPREVCVPNNCAMVPGEEVRRTKIALYFFTEKLKV